MFGRRKKKEVTKKPVDISFARAELAKGADVFAQYVTTLAGSDKEEDREMINAISSLAYTNTAEMLKDTAAFLKEQFRKNLPKEYQHVKSMLNTMLDEEKNYPEGSNLIGLSKSLSQVCINYQYMIAGSKTEDDFKLFVKEFNAKAKALNFKNEPEEVRSKAKKYIKFIQHDVLSAVAAL